MDIKEYMGIEKKKLKEIFSVEIIKLTKENKKKDLFYGHEIIKRFGLWTK